MLVKEFQTIAAKLRRRLAAVEAVNAEFSGVYAALATDYLEQAASCLAAIQGPEQMEEAHRARIAAKHLRYLLEPVVSEHRPLSASVKALAALQDVLGELHDAHVFAEHLKGNFGHDLGPESVSFLQSRNLERRDRSYESLRDRWLTQGTCARLGEIRRSLPTA